MPQRGDGAIVTAVRVKAISGSMRPVSVETKGKAVWRRNTLQPQCGRGATRRFVIRPVIKLSLRNILLRGTSTQTALRIPEATS
jgi:hypothetical protein